MVIPLPTKKFFYIQTSFTAPHLDEYICVYDFAILVFFQSNEGQQLFPHPIVEFVEKQN